MLPHVAMFDMQALFRSRDEFYAFKRARLSNILIFSPDALPAHDAAAAPLSFARERRDLRRCLLARATRLRHVNHFRKKKRFTRLRAFARR